MVGSTANGTPPGTSCEATTGRALGLASGGARRGRWTEEERFRQAGKAPADAGARGTATALIAEGIRTDAFTTTKRR